MALTGIGLDVLEIDRLERALARRPRLAERVFTDGERAYAAGRARPARHLAARFCAKEAVAKALGMPAWAFHEVEVVAGAGAPSVRLHGALAARAHRLGVTPLVSLSHERSLAVAAAVLAPASPEPPRAAGSNRRTRRRSVPGGFSRLWPGKSRGSGSPLANPKRRGRPG